eukprot:874-Heterococcus_DN1.PRE.1
MRVRRATWTLLECSCPRALKWTRCMTCNLRHWSVSTALEMRKSTNLGECAVSQLCIACWY